MTLLVYIHSFHHRRQVGQEGFALGISILTTPSAFFYSIGFFFFFLSVSLEIVSRRICYRNFVGFEVRLTTLYRSVALPSYFFWKIDVVCHFSVVGEFL